MYIYICTYCLNRVYPCSLTSSPHPKLFIPLEIATNVYTKQGGLRPLQSMFPYGFCGFGPLVFTWGKRLRLIFDLARCSVEKQLFESYSHIYFVALCFVERQVFEII